MSLLAPLSQGCQLLLETGYRARQLFSLPREEQSPILISDAFGLMFTRESRATRTTFCLLPSPWLKPKKDFLSGSKATPRHLLYRIGLISAKKHSGLLGTCTHFEAVHLFCVFLLGNS